MDMVASGHSRLAARAHHLAAFHHVALVHINMAQMTVERHQPIAMVNHNAVAIDAQRGSIYNAAIIRGLDTHMLRNREIISEMDLLIDLLPLVNVVPQIREGC